MTNQTIDYNIAVASSSRGSPGYYLPTIACTGHGSLCPRRSCRWVSNVNTWGI